MVEPHSSNFREITTNVLGVRIFRNFTVSHLMTKPTKWPVRPVRTPISLGICPVWSESSLSTWRKLGSLATHWVQSKNSDQANLSLCRAHSHSVGFVMSGLIIVLIWFKCCWKGYKPPIHPSTQNKADMLCNFAISRFSVKLILEIILNNKVEFHVELVKLRKNTDRKHLVNLEHTKKL